MFETVKSCYAGKFISKNEWKHSDRVIDTYEIIFVTKGTAYINNGGTEYALGPNDILLIEPGVRHFGYKTSTDTVFFWMHWNSDTKILKNINGTTLQNPYHIVLYFRQLIEAQVMSKPIETRDYLTRLILIEIDINTQQPKTNTVAEKIKVWIQANSNSPITTTEIANYFGYNADYVNRVFKKSFQKSVKQYIDEERIRYIKMLMINQNIPLKKVATRAGFSDYKYFLKFFKYHEGITPTEFYKQFVILNINSR